MGQSVWLPTIRVEAGLSGPTVDPTIWHIGDPVRGQVGVAKIGPDNVWVDITSAVRSWSFRRGANRGAGIELRYEAGTFTCELNNGDRAFDPNNLAGPYAASGITTLLPMVRVRLVAVYGGVSYPLWAGLADSWIPDYSQPTWSTTTLTATDMFKVLANRNRLAQALAGANEDSGARIGRILTSVGWDTNDRNLETGNSVMQATDLSGSALAEAQLVQDSEQGEFYVDGTGRPTYRNRHAVLIEARSNTAQATFGDGGLGAGEIPYASTAVDTDDITLANRVVAQIAGSTNPQVSEDLNSQAKYLVKEYSRTDLILTTDAEALSWAQSILGQSDTAELRFAQVSFNVPTPDAQAVTWPALLGRELGDRITVVRRPPGGGSPITQDCWVRGIEMSSDGADWKTTLQLEATGRTNFWTIGHPTLGRIGSVGIAF